MAKKAKQQDKKEKKKTEDASFEEAYDSILGYHKDYKYDEENGPYYSED